MTDQRVPINQFLDSKVRYDSVGDSRQRGGSGHYDPQQGKLKIVTSCAQRWRHAVRCNAKKFLNAYQKGTPTKHRKTESVDGYVFQG